MANVKRQKFKAIFFDIDGTITPNGITTKPTKVVKDALNKLGKSIYTGVATGRTLRQASFVLSELTFNGLSIFANGAQIIDWKTKKVVDEKIINLEIVHEAYQIAKSYGYLLHVYDDGKDNTEINTVTYPISAFILAVHPEHIPEIKGTLERIGKNTKVIITNSLTPDCNDIHVVNTKAGKDLALAECAKILGIKTSEIISVGDGANDMELMKASGYKIVMSNGIPELKALADYICPSLEVNGAALAIDYLFNHSLI